MATETLYPDAVLTQTGLTGALSTIASAEDGSWMTSTATNRVLRVSFPTPTGNPNTGAGLQTFRVYVRKDASGGGDPTVDELSLYENGTLVTTILAGDLVTSATGQAVTVTWDASGLGTADGSVVELRAVCSKGGGGPNERNVEFDSVSWEVDYTAAGAVTVEANLGTVSTNGFTATIAVTDHQVVEANLGTVSTSGLTPTVVASDHQVVVANLGTISISGFTPTVATTANVQIVANLGTISTSGLIPTVTATAHQTVTANLGAVTVAGFAPVVVTDASQTVQANLGTISVTGFTPVIALSDHKVVVANAGSVSASGFTTTILVTDDKVVAANLGAIAVSGLTPGVSVSGGAVTVMAKVGSITVSGLSAIVATSRTRRITVPRRRNIKRFDRV